MEGSLTLKKLNKAIPFFLASVAQVFGRVEDTVLEPVEGKLAVNGLVGKVSAAELDGSGGSPGEAQDDHLGEVGIDEAADCV